MHVMPIPKNITKQLYSKIFIPNNYDYNEEMKKFGFTTHGNAKVVLNLKKNTFHLNKQNIQMDGESALDLYIRFMHSNLPIFQGIIFAYINKQIFTWRVYNDFSYINGDANIKSKIYTSNEDSKFSFFNIHKLYEFYNEDITFYFSPIWCYESNPKIASDFSKGICLALSYVWILNVHGCPSNQSLTSLIYFTNLPAFKNDTSKAITISANFTNNRIALINDKNSKFLHKNKYNEELKNIEKQYKFPHIIAYYLSNGGHAVVFQNNKCIWDPNRIEEFLPRIDFPRVTQNNQIRSMISTFIFDSCFRGDLEERTNRINDLSNFTVDIYYSFLRHH
jgi:hypothetical protein